MKKKFAALAMTAAMLTSILAGCGNEDSGDTGATVAEAVSETAEAATSDSATDAEVLSTDESEENTDSEADTIAADTSISGHVTLVTANDTTGAVEHLISEFSKAYPNIEVDLQMSSGASDDVKQSLMTSFAAGDSDPDVIACDIIWVSQFAAAGWLLDVTDELEAISDQYLGGPLKTCYYDGRAYAFPDYTDVGLLYYRTDIIDTPPTTWEELVALSKEHQGEGGTDYGYLFQMLQGEPTSCNMLEFIKQNGGHDLLDGQFSLANDNTYEALDFVQSLIADGITPEDVLGWRPDDSLSVFNEGKAIFMRNWTYAYARTQSDESKVVGNVGVTSLPIGPNGTESSGTLGGWNYAINSQTDEPEASLALVKFLSSYDAQKIETIERSTFPTIGAVYDDAEVLEALPYLPSIKDAADNAAPRPQVRDYPTISTIFQEYFHKVLAGGADAETTITEMDVKLNEALAEMQ